MEGIKALNRLELPLDIPKYGRLRMPMRESVPQIRKVFVKKV